MSLRLCLFLVNSYLFPVKRHLLTMYIYLRDQWNDELFPNLVHSIHCTIRYQHDALTNWGRELCGRVNEWPQSFWRLRHFFPDVFLFFSCEEIIFDLLGPMRWYNLSLAVTHLLGVFSICLCTFIYVFDLLYLQVLPPSKKKCRFFTFTPCLVPTQKLYTLSHRMFGHMYGVLNID
jgi:hypothetical protein